MRKAVFTLLCLLGAKANAQISIYNCDLVPPVTQAMIDTTMPYLRSSCIRLDGNHEISGTASKKIVSGNYINLKPGFKGGAFTGSGKMHLKIEPPVFDVSLLNYNSFDHVEKNKKLELGIGLPVDIGQKVINYINGVNTADTINPYLEWEIRVTAEFFSWSSYEISEVDGFYTKEFTSAMVESLPAPADTLYNIYNDEEYWSLGSWTEIPGNLHPFRVRFTPRSTGKWACIVRIYVGEEIYTAPLFFFDVINTGAHGFMEIGEKGAYLVMDNQTFFPIGCNMNWPTTDINRDPELGQYMGERSENYRHYYTIPRVYEKYKDAMTLLADNGGNYVRTIMYPKSTEIEWEKLGNYTQRLHMAQELDKILEHAEEEGLYIHWDLQSHFNYQLSGAAYGNRWTWEYETVEGDSFCYHKLIQSDNPVDFFTHEEAKKYYKQRLRYIISRYGYSTNIAMFELWCEINNIGTTTADASVYYHLGSNWTVYRNWQLEMAQYIKSLANGNVHLLTANTVGNKHPDDNMFLSSYLDVMTFNSYDYDEPDFAKGWQFAEVYLNEDRKPLSHDCKDGRTYVLDCGSDEGRNKKPLMLSETGPFTIERACPTNYIETNRHMWTGLFSGLAGALNWDHWLMTDNYAIMGQMRDFMSGINLNGDDWRPGAIKRTNDDPWIYKADYADMEGENVDMAYLRSGDGDFAIGVLTNKTYNVYNTSDCFDTLWPSNFLVDQVIANPSDDMIKIRDMKIANYTIDYYLPTNLTTPIHTQTSVLGGDLPLAIDIVPSEETYIVLFRAHRHGASWMSQGNGSDPNVENHGFAEEVDPDSPIEKVSDKVSQEPSMSIKVFPVPSTHFVSIELEQHMGIVDVTIQSIDGRTIEVFAMKGEKEKLDISTYEGGTYILNFSVKGQRVGVRKIVKV